MPEDANWPRASAWLGGGCLPDPDRRMTVIAVPLCRGSITPGRCDLGPAAIRGALSRFSTWDFDAHVDVRRVRVEDRGDLPVAELSVEEAFAPVAAEDPLVLLGGDNSVTRMGVHGLGLERTALLTIDAHLDVRDLEGGLSNGNPVRALLADGLPGDRIVQVGIQSFANSPRYAEVAWEAGIRVVTADAVRERGILAVVSEALDRLARHAEHIYVDVDLDVMDRAFAPACPGARPGGLMPADLRRAAHLCGQHPKVRAMDLVEMDPTQDVGQRTAMAAAACMLAFASGLVQRNG